ncbi:hypothetical protein M407DRAFT_119747 [Tulasnella calospora MUT 4182]|uniref:Uncharacterized protein n=1 Tax=Tulasnella calospora MUT 4182 TaxID=1051891 RepID=A0A0C3QB44_9AGAM|nr:hypothetical protein M407DRAFT_119747 [Tulasnella calospora MUT 4182]
MAWNGESGSQSCAAWLVPVKSSRGPPSTCIALMTMSTSWGGIVRRACGEFEERGLMG